MKRSRPPLLSLTLPFGNIGQTCSMEGGRVTGVETGDEGCESEREKEREDYFCLERTRRYSYTHARTPLVRTPCLELLSSLPFTMPFYPKIQKRGDLLVCAEAERNAWGRLRSPFPPRVRVIRSSTSRSRPPSEPNFSLTKPFLFGNLFRDRNSLSQRPLSPVIIAI